MCLGVPGQILDVDDTPLRMGRVAFGPTIKDVSLACVPDAGPGAWVVVHACLALDELGEEAARLMLEGLAQLELPSEEAQA